MKNPAKAAAGSKGGKMRQAPNREAIQASRMKQAMELRIQGRTFEEIGSVLGMSRERARVLHDEALEATLGETKKMATRMRHQQLVRLEKVEVRLLGLLLDPRLKVRKNEAGESVMELADFEALNRLSNCLVKNYERQAKLAGADAPVKVEQAAQGEGLNLATLAAIVAEKRRAMRADG